MPQLINFVMVHGAWLGGWCWDAVAAALKERGHTVRAVSLPAHGGRAIDAADVSLEDYANAVIETLDEYDGKSVLVGHSFGGVTISRAAELRPEKLSSLIYVAAFLLPNGTSFSAAAANVRDSAALTNLRLSEDGTTVAVAAEAAHDAVAHDVPLAAFLAAAGNMVAEPTAPLNTPLKTSSERWGQVPRYYVHTTEDRALPLAAQKAMVARLPVAAERTLTTSHVPFFSAPVALALCLLELLDG